MDYSIRKFNFSSCEYAEALNLRTRILRTPLGLEFTKEELKKDEEDIHLGLFENGKLLACLTLVGGRNGRMKMRQVAVEG